MPLIKISVYKGKSEVHCQAILDGVHAALVDTLGIPDYNIIQELTEFEPSRFRRPGDRSDNFTMVEVRFFEGRTHEQKRASTGPLPGTCPGRRA